MMAAIKARLARIEAAPRPEPAITARDMTDEQLWAVLGLSQAEGEAMSDDELHQLVARAAHDRIVNSDEPPEPCSRRIEGHPSCRECGTPIPDDPVAASKAYFRLIDRTCPR